MPAVALTEERGRRTLAFLVEHYDVQRANWEVDYPEMVEGLLAMAAGREPLGARFAAVAGDTTYVFIELADSEEEALELLGSWTEDANYPRCPLAIADLQEGVIHGARVTVSRALSPPKRLDEEVRS